MTSEFDPCPPTVDRRAPLRTATAHDRHDGSTVRLAAELDFLDCTGLRALVDARVRTRCSPLAP